MRVMFLEDVDGVAQGGEVREVKNGFARNYLIPKRLAVPATRDAMQRINRLTKQADGERVRRLGDMKELAEHLEGTEVKVEMRAGTSGRLYGSVTNAIVADQLAESIGREVDRRTVELPESIRQVGLYDVRVRLHADIDAQIKLLVYPVGSDPDEVRASLEESEDESGEAATGEDEAVPEVEQAEPDEPEVEPDEPEVEQAAVDEPDSG